MNTVMIYMIHNRVHNWFYIGISFTSSIRAEKHYTEKFSPNKDSMLLSEYHAGEIMEQGKNLADEIIILPIILFPILLRLNIETKNKLENLMRIIESRLISTCKKVGYNFYNDPILLSLNASKLIKIPFKATIENVKDYCLERVANLKCIPYPFEKTLTKVKKVLFYDLRNQFERKVPKFFENEIYKDWFTSLEFWTDLEEKYGIETVRKVISHAQNLELSARPKESNFLDIQKEFQLLLLEKYYFNMDSNSNIEAIPNTQKTLDINSSFNVSESKIQEVKDYVMEKVEKKICISFKFEPHIGKTKTSLFYNIRNQYYRKAPNFFDILIYKNWFCTP
nr:hypothetical protein [Trentepohlia sp. YN1317]